jgi:hypothetical protein
MRALTTLLVAAGALVLAAVAGADQRYSDGAGDSGSAPDLTQVAVANDPSNVTFEIDAPARLPAGDEAVLLDIDSDGNPSTGDEGFEARAFMNVAGSEVETWNGSAWASAPPAGISIRFELSSSRGFWRVVLPRTIVGTSAAWNFVVLSAKFSGDAIVGFDAAPDRGAWRYELALKQCANGRDDDGDGKVDSDDLGCSGTDDDLESDDPYTLSIGRPTVTPATGKAGKPVVVRARVLQVETKQPIQTGSVRCTTKVGSVSKRSAGQLSAGNATCRLMAPKVARTATVRGTVTVTSKTATVSTPFAFRVTK